MFDPSGLMTHMVHEIAPKSLLDTDPCSRTPSLLIARAHKVLMLDAVPHDQSANEGVRLSRGMAELRAKQVRGGESLRFHPSTTWWDKCMSYILLRCYAGELPGPFRLSHVG